MPECEVKTKKQKTPTATESFCRFAPFAFFVPYWYFGFANNENE
jgi:hypothetical protein